MEAAVRGGKRQRGAPKGAERRGRGLAGKGQWGQGGVKSKINQKRAT